MNLSLNQIVGRRIRQERKAQNITQTELAEKIGKSLRTVQKYESGEIDISLAMIEQISAVLNVGLSSFFNELPTTNKERFLNEISIMQREAYDFQHRLIRIKTAIESRLNSAGLKGSELIESLDLEKGYDSDFLEKISSAYDRAETEKRN